MMNEILNPIQKVIVDRLFSMAIGRSAEEADSIEVEGVVCNIQNPGTMTKEVFLRLQALNECMESDVAQGHDCLDGFDACWAEIERLMDAAPWRLCPDEGCIHR